MIRSIIFDWGGVLVDDPKDKFLVYCANSLGAELSALKDVFSGYSIDFQKGTILEDDLWTKICTKLSIPKPPKKSLWKSAARNIINDKIDVYNLIPKLRSKGYTIGFLSNTEIPTMEYFIENNYERYFDATTFSCAEKTVKPEEKIYRLTLEKLCVTADEAIFIDDKPKYVEGARKIGINGIVFKNYETLKKELSLFSIHLPKETT